MFCRFNAPDLWGRTCGAPGKAPHQRTQGEGRSVGNVHFAARYPEKGDKCLLVIGLILEKMVARYPSSA